MRRPRIFIAAVLAIAVSTPHDLRGATNRQLRTINISVQSVLTVTSALVQRNIHSPRQFFVCLFTGAASGYGFYAAKRSVARNDATTGVLIANAAASLSENVAAGRNPFSHIGYSVGPVRFRVATPLAKDAPAYINIDIAQIEAVALAEAISEADDRGHFQDGLIVFRRGSRDDDMAGKAWGMFPMIIERAGATYPHEFIHAVQALQLDSIEPPLYSKPRRNGHKRLIDFGDYKAGFAHLTFELVDKKASYENRWTEIEAEHFEK